jgi:hypothetical protein
MSQRSRRTTLQVIKGFSQKDFGFVRRDGEVRESKRNWRFGSSTRARCALRETPYSERFSREVFERRSSAVPSGAEGLEDLAGTGLDTVELPGVLRRLLLDFARRSRGGGASTRIRSQARFRH